MYCTFFDILQSIRGNSIQYLLDYRGSTLVHSFTMLSIVLFLAGVTCMRNYFKPMFILQASDVTSHYMKIYLNALITKYLQNLVYKNSSSVDFLSSLLTPSPSERK